MKPQIGAETGEQQGEGTLVEYIDLLSGFLALRLPDDIGRAGHELTLEVKKGSASHAKLEYYVYLGELLPLLHKDESLAVSLRSMEEDDKCICGGTLGFLGPGIGGT